MSYENTPFTCTLYIQTMQGIVHVFQESLCSSLFLSLYIQCGLLVNNVLG